ncbi:MAG TPA: hypothetical protein PKJ19_10900 [Flavobacteriales bacterium]|nr:hypothetical protein [Flavobacteriales bacterium]HNU57279.1 hypothetical protein [Flavobacteriales bacterium]
MTRERTPLRPAQADEDCIRVRLNPRTIVLIKSMKHFAYWKERYPDATLMDPVGTGPDKEPRDPA